jgi:DNA polymerase gamma 1
MHKYQIIKQLSRSNPNILLNSFQDSSIKLNLKNYQTNSSPRFQNENSHLSEVPINQVGIQMINEKLRSYLFNEKHVVKGSDIEKAADHLKKFGLFLKESQPVEDVDQLNLPNLKGKNIEEHFYNIAREKTVEYNKLLNKLTNNGIPNMPKQFEFKAGWTRYDPITNRSTSVEYPPDDALVFDVESLVMYKNCPVLAVAVSNEAWYSWCSQRLINNDFMYLNSLQISDLIPFESHDLNIRQSKKRVAVGHNVGFDRSYIKEQYFIEVRLNYNIT